VVTPETECLLSLPTRNPAEKTHSAKKVLKSCKKKIRGIHTASADNAADKVIESMLDMLIDLMNVIEPSQKDISTSWMKPHLKTSILLNFSIKGGWTVEMALVSNHQNTLAMLHPTNH
jgi:hypothetical protein